MRATILSLLFAAIGPRICTAGNISIEKEINHKNKITMTITDFSTTILVDQTPAQVFKAITNVRAWWTEEVEGNTEKLNDVFTQHYKDVHATKIKIIEMVPDQKIVWLVQENHFNFTKDASEWTGNKMIFEITSVGKKTQLRFTQQGLVPEYECYSVCSDAWHNYIDNSLRSFITTGKGQPNPKEGGFNEQVISKYNLKDKANMKTQDYSTSFTVNATPAEAFKGINNVTGWWTDNLAGHSQKLNDEFTVRFFNDLHVSTQKLIEVVPDKKVVWLVTDSKLNFISDKQEWTNTKISFEISVKDSKTQVNFTHIGLTPGIECYKDCSNAWGDYMQSLKSLINTGKGNPTLK